MQLDMFLRDPVSIAKVRHVAQSVSEHFMLIHVGEGNIH
jgi:hypothetical protein